MPRGATAHELGDRLLQIYDEIKAYPLREQHGYGGLGAREPRAARDERRDGRRVLFISGLDGGLRSAQLGLFDQHGHLLFSGTVPGGEVEVLGPGEWVEEFLRLHRQIAGFLRQRLIRDPYGLERQVR